ncbi:MAG: GAF domain-containing protein [Nitrospirae bacterium]|nr:GAF domain-containing protein [Nitrospirota bacterium]
MGAEIIGSGDLDYKVGTDKSDEIGQLSRSFDRMAENLKKVTASRDELDLEIAEREKAEEARRRAVEVLRASLRISEHALHHGLDELLTKTLDEAEKLTASRIGFFHFVEADQVTLRLQTWSTNTLSSMCTAEGKGAHYPVDKAGVWVDAIVRKAPVVHNDYESLPHKKGLPPGHAPVVRELVAPILRGGLVVGVIGVGNKAEEYDDGDVEAVSQLAGRAWDVILAKLAELELDEYRRNLEVMVEARTAELTAANKELEAFSYSVSHDLRAPLRHIQGFVELLAKNAGAALDEKGGRYLSTISVSATRMGELIDDLLTFSRMGRAEMRMTAVDLGRMAENVVQEMRTDVEGRDVRWVIGGMPPVYGDPSMLRLVMVNLLSNALKFTATRAHASIEFGCLPGDGKEVTFFVRDDGVGFDMQYVDKLFGVFQRLHKSEEFEGTGIGLANVRRIISRHGGRTWAEGALGEGAAIYFTLPAHYEGEPDERA